MRSNILIIIAITTYCLVSSCGDNSEKANPEVLRLASMSEVDVSGYLHDLGSRDLIAPFLQSASTRQEVLMFFSSLARSEKVAGAILDNAERNGIRTSLAFALALEESRFQPNAVNDNGDSIDRGLFQLNSKSFPNLTAKEVFDPETNARFGLAHLRYCLNEAGNDVTGLAMYNAGNGRVGRGATPKRTLDYVSHVIAYEGNIMDLFEAKVASKTKRPASVIAMGEGKAAND
jgi:soluble lytic murein transglycosylase-like protein